ncbi:MAG TPA: GntR family transcriptional regulator [Candidatus Sumerlaeota bacterium]|nr:GntR family transcriptional regulator [Candidatus Sumerlaeota bacterium]HOR28905.1 GntR family transcriptional regulator [Candidatus Sumerlaeota bacterium]
MSGLIKSTTRKKTKANGRSIPLYESIVRQLAEEMSSLRPGDRFSTLDDLCERFQTSKITARRAISELARLGYVTAKPGVGLLVSDPREQTQTKDICFLTNGIHAGGAMPLLLQGIERVARQEGYHLLLNNTEADAELNHLSVEWMLEHSVAGTVISLPHNMQECDWLHEVLTRIEAHRIPAVLVDSRFIHGESKVPYVVAENYEGAMQAVEHLTQLGHRRIAAINESYNSACLERKEGFRGGLLKYGADYDPKLFPDFYIHEEYERCAEAIDYFLGLKAPPTAIFCNHDLIAQKCILLLQERGVRVPEDISIVGFDDLPFSEHCRPPLTTIRQPLIEIGAEAAALLLHRIRVDFDYRPCKRLPTRLILRRSTAPCPGQGGAFTT